jgi:hypothetical protein
LTQGKDNMNLKVLWWFYCACKIESLKMPLPANSLFFALKDTLIILQE